EEAGGVLPVVLLPLKGSSSGGKRNSCLYWNNESKFALLNTALFHFVEAPVCKHWKFHGRCLYKEKCFFSHPQEVLEEYNRKQAEIEENGGRKRNRGPGKRNK
ncbi:hypothetical protein FOZ63_013659, partial [Perkinsus olseni]